jgi:hypothetical protein
MTSKIKIPKAVREQVWLVHVGPKFQNKCKVSWCTNTMNVFDFQCGHNIPESKGGATDVNNLVPICSRCNLSMGSQFTIDEWNKKFASRHQSWWTRMCSCFKGQESESSAEVTLALSRRLDGAQRHPKMRAIVVNDPKAN